MDSKPSNVDDCFHSCDIMLDAIQESDLFIEGLEAWLFGLDSYEDLGSHPSEGGVFNFLAVVVVVDMLLLSWIFTGIQEVLEALSQSLLPKEVHVLVLVDE